MDSESDRCVSVRCTLLLIEGSTAGIGSILGEGGGLGSFLCALSGVLGLIDGGLDIVDDVGGGVVDDSRAADVTLDKDFLGFSKGPEIEMPSPDCLESGVYAG